jgi:hypothetical protein
MSRNKTKKLKVVVKKKHIFGGQPNEGDQCAIALALMDKGFTKVAVDGNDITGYKNEVLYGTGKVPKSAKSFIEKYDNSKFDEDTNEYTFTVKPFSFNLVLQEVDV